MNKITEVVKIFFIRLKYKNFEKHEQFIITFMFTYLLTVAFAVLVIFKYFENIMVLLNYPNDLWDFINSNEYNFTFGNCKNLDAKLYLAARLYETLIPTTLTFSGTIFVLQTTKEKNIYLNAFLAIILFLITMIGMLFMVSSLKATLKMHMWELLILFFLAIILSNKAFTLQSKENSSHKNEHSDGQIIG